MGTKRGHITVLLQGLILLFLITLAPPPLAAITFTDAGAGFFSEPVVTLAPFKPVGLTFTPDGRLFIWQRDGVIRIVKNGVLLPTPFLDFSSKVNTYTDHGFLGVALDPNFAANGWVYLFYTYEAGGNPNDTTPKTDHLSRVTADPNNPDVMLANSEVILLGTVDVPPCSQYPVGTDCIPTDSYTHSVGSLRFLQDGTLFASHGDGASASFADVLALRSQSLDSYAGKILRIKPDGSAPQAPLTVNPFNDGTNSIRSKVWAYGLRNPFRFGVHPTTGLPYIGDVGWNNWEEINIGTPGANYGWPCWEGNGQQPGYQAAFPAQCQPVTSAVVTSPSYTYDHSVGSAAIGGAFFTGAQYPVAYRGNFFFADYPKGWMKRMVFDGSGNVQSVLDFASAIGNVNGGVVAIELGPDGLLYYVVFTTGEIARIRNTSGTGSNFPPFAAAATTTPAAGYSPLQVGFSSAASSDPEGGALTYLWEFGDGATDTDPNPVHTYTAGGVATFPVRLTVTDPLGAKSTASLTVVVGSTPPVATIDLPTTGAQFTVGQTATYHGAATDPDVVGPLPSTALHWTVLLHHNTHIHPFIDTTGSGGSFPVDNHDPLGTWAYEFILTATDSSGLTDTKSITTPVNPPPPAAPVLLYGMNEGTSTTTADLSGNGHAGTLINGPAWVAGQASHGTALSFDGVNDELAVTNPSTFNFGTQDFTLELWAQRNVLDGHQQHLFSKFNNATSTAGYKEFYFKANNVLAFGANNTDVLSSTITDLNWHHYTVTHSATTNALKIYIDGVLTTTATFSLTADGADHLVKFGTLKSGAQNNTFSGTLDDVRIYTRILSAAEVVTDMNTPVSPPGPDTTPPTAPGTPTATAVNATQINLTWTTATDNVGVTGYRVERCADAGCVNFLEVGQPIGTSFGDTGLTPLTTYRYQVRAIDAASNLGPYSTIASATTPALDTTPPTAPTGLGATASGSSQITLNWTAATDNVGVTGYGLERCQGTTCTTFAQIATPSGTTYNDTGLLPSTTYQYQVRATDAAGNFSGYSNIASATTAAATGLVDAYAFTEGTSITTADLSGNGHAGTLINGPAWVAGQASHGTALSFDGVDDELAVTNPSTFNFGTQDFTLELWAQRNVLDGHQQHLFSKFNNATSTAGYKEFYFKANNVLAFGANNTDVLSSTITDLNWHHYAVTHSATTNALKIYIDGVLTTTATLSLTADGADHLVKFGTLKSGAQNNTFSGTLDDVRIYTRILSAAEVVTDMNTPVSPPGPDTTPPTAPGTPTATAVNATQINLTWTTATDNVGVTGYRVERCADAGCVNFLEVGQPIGTSFGDTGLTPLTTYRYQVRAIDAASNLGPYSTIASATTPALDTTPPTAPTGLGATASGSSQITLNWTAATDNVGVTGYGLERCQGTTCTTFAQIATPSGTTYNDTGLLPSTTYQYQVRATDAAGNFSGYSNIASATTAAATGLVDAYAFTEGTSITTADLSGNGHAGTLINGPAWVAGQASHGTALSFDGVDDELAVTNPSTFNFGTQDFTLELWAQRNVLDGHQQHLFSKFNNATSTAGYKEFYFKANNVLAFGANNTDVPVEHDHGSQLASLRGHAQRHDERAQDLHRRRADDDGDAQSHSRRRRSSRQVRHAQVRGSKQHFLRHARRHANLHAHLVGRRGRDGYEYPGESAGPGHDAAHRAGNADRDGGECDADQSHLDDRDR